MKELYGLFVKPGDLVFNAGAGHGVRTAVFLSLGAKVVALEPQQDLCRELMDLSPTGELVVYCGAVGSEVGEVELHLCTSDVRASCSREWIEAVRDRFPRDKWDRTVVVPMITLDALIDQFGVPSFIKLDIEGYEVPALQALSQPVDALSFEFTAGLMEPVSEALVLLLRLGRYQFNYTVQEDPKLRLPEWVDAARILEAVGGVPKGHSNGDIFAVKEGTMAKKKEDKLEMDAVIGEPEEGGPIERPVFKRPVVGDGMVVNAPGEGIWCIDGGVRRLVPDPVTQICMGISQGVTLTPEELEAIPIGEPMPKLRPKKRSERRRR